MIYREEDLVFHQQIVDLKTNAIVTEKEFDVAQAEKDMEGLKVPRKPLWDGLRTPKEQKAAEDVKIVILRGLTLA